VSTQSEPRTRLISELATELAEVTPVSDVTGQGIAVAVYRLLGEGRPVTPDALAERVGLAASEIAAVLDALPGVYRDERGAVIGFWGLALQTMPHRLLVDGRTLGVEDVSPSGAVLPMVRSDSGFGDDVISSFCRHILFFASDRDGETWTMTHPGTSLLSLEEGFRLGELTWRARLGGALDESIPIEEAEELR
jgi:hypothetical protein